MKHELLRHRIAYVSLIIGLCGLTLLFFAVWPNRWAQRGVIVSMATFYVLWGITTHLKTKTITKQVMYEYGGVAALGGVVALMITF